MENLFPFISSHSRSLHTINPSAAPPPPPPPPPMGDSLIKVESDALSSIYDLEYRASDDNAWYNVRVLLDHSAEKLTVKFWCLPEDLEVVFSASEFVSDSEVDDLVARFRPVSKQLLDHQCGMLTVGTTVCAAHATAAGDLRFYDAVIQAVKCQAHSFANGKEECLCNFDLCWEHGRGHGTVTSVNIGSICIVEPATQLDPRISAFSMMAMKKISSFMTFTGKNDCAYVEEKPGLAQIKLPVDWTWKRPSLQGANITPHMYVKITVIDDIRDELTLIGQDYYERFRQSCFGRFLSLDAAGYCCNSSLHALMAREVLKSDALADERWFSVGDQLIRFSRYEFALVMGLRFGDSSFNPSREHVLHESSLFMRRFSGEQPFVLEELLNRFKAHAFRDSGDDTVKIAQILFVYFILFGVDTWKAYVDTWVWALVEDSSMWNSFPWGKFTYIKLLRDIDGIPCSISPKANPSKWRYHFFGCTLALLLWAYECVPRLGMQFGRMVSDEHLQRPRCIRWRLRRRKLNLSTFFDKHVECRQFMMPDALEKEEAYWANIHDDLTIGVQLACRKYRRHEITASGQSLPQIADSTVVTQHRPRKKLRATLTHVPVFEDLAPEAEFPSIDARGHEHDTHDPPTAGHVGDCELPNVEAGVTNSHDPFTTGHAEDSELPNFEAGVANSHDSPTAGHEGDNELPDVEAGVTNSHDPLTAGHPEDSELPNVEAGVANSHDPPTAGHVKDGEVPDVEAGVANSHDPPTAGYFEDSELRNVEVGIANSEADAHANCRLPDHTLPLLAESPITLLRKEIAHLSENVDSVRTSLHRLEANLPAIIGQQLRLLFAQQRDVAECQSAQMATTPDALRSSDSPSMSTPVAAPSRFQAIMEGL